MKELETRDTNPEIPKKTNPKKSPGGTGFSWFYVLLLSFFLMLTIFKPSTGIKEITWLEFERDLLEQHHIEKLVVVNNQIVEIYIKK